MLTKSQRSVWQGSLGTGHVLWLGKEPGVGHFFSLASHVLQREICKRILMSTKNT